MGFAKNACNIKAKLAIKQNKIYIHTPVWYNVTDSVVTFCDSDVIMISQK